MVVEFPSPSDHLLLAQESAVPTNLMHPTPLLAFPQTTFFHPKHITPWTGLQLMSPAALLLTCITVLNVTIGVYVYRRNPTEASHRAFAFMAIMLGGWTIGLIGAHYSPFGKTLAMRIAFAAASLIPIGVLSFVENTPRHSPHNVARRSRPIPPRSPCPLYCVLLSIDRRLGNIRRQFLYSQIRTTPSRLRLICRRVICLFHLHLTSEVSGFYGSDKDTYSAFDFCVRGPMHSSHPY